MLTLVALAGFQAAAAQELHFEVDEHGVVRNVRWGDGPPVSQIFVLVPVAGWNGAVFAQEGWRPQTTEQAPDGRSFLLSGRHEGEKGTVEVEQRVTADQNGRLNIAYRLRFLREAETEGVRLLVRVPTDPWSGEGRAVLGVEDLGLAKRLPAERAEPRHLLSTSAPAWAAWQLGDYLTVIRPQGCSIADAMVQDDREWQMQCFEMQLNMRAGRSIQAGEEVAFAVALEPATVAEMEGQGVRIVESQNRWDVAKVELSATGELSIGDVRWSHREGPRWRPVELSFPVTGTWDNPFDPQEIDVQAVIETPDGQVLRQPAFLYQDFGPVGRAPGMIAPKGSPEWRVRWTPMQEGTYRVRLEAENRGQRTTRDAGTFACAGSEGRGFIRRSPYTPYYLCFDDGSPYFAIGENICWDRDDMVAAYEKWFSRLGAAGGNYCRIWLVRWNMGLEWSNTDGARRGCFYGLGRYSLDNAWRLDRVLDLARQHGIYVMLCLGYHGELMDTRGYFGEDCWGFNPYNVANGGPCEKPADFWTNERARQLYKQRLRYYLARWGAYPNVLSFEFWNEVWAPAPWIAEMSAFMRQNDIHRHLLTTTYGGDDVWLLDTMDYAQAHYYGSDEDCPDAAPFIYARSMSWTEKYQKPFMMGEFGIDWKRSDNVHDPKGIGTNMHNGLWAAVVGRSFGTAAIWYWDAYVDALNLYPQFTSVARFAEMVDWVRFNPRRAETQIEWLTPPGEKAFADLPLALPSEWRRQGAEEFSVSPDGLVSPELPTCFLFGPAKANMQSALRLRFTAGAPGQAKLIVSRVSSLSVLSVKLDGEEVLRREYRCGPPGEGRYKQTDWMEQWKIWQSTFDEEVAIDVPAGEHVLELSNVEGDWMTIPRIILPAARDATLPHIDAWVLADERQAVGWLHDRESIWWSDRDGKELKEQAPLRLTFAGLRDGAYELSWYDTWAGQVVRSQTIAVKGGKAEVISPPFKRDIALIVKPLD